MSWPARSFDGPLPDPAFESVTPGPCGVAGHTWADWARPWWGAIAPESAEALTRSRVLEGYCRKCRCAEIGGEI